jgi:histidinol-phosphate/aromatic aminotransferase/cobyric acid decarboxylase-like protein
VHFFLVRVGSAMALTQRLLERGILVRQATSFGLQAFVRIATRKPEESARLVDAMKELRCWPEP